MANLPENYRSNRSLFDDAWRDFDELFSRSLLPSMSPFYGARNYLSTQPRMDIDELDNGYLMTFEVPGFSKDDIKIDVQNNVLSVMGDVQRKEEWTEREEEAEGREEGRMQRRMRFSRSLSLPMDLDPDKIEASCENGILEIYIPKSEEQRTRPVNIGSGQRLSQRLKSRVREVTGKGQEPQGEGVGVTAKSAQAKSASSKTTIQKEEESRH